MKDRVGHKFFIFRAIFSWPKPKVHILYLDQGPR